MWKTLTIIWIILIVLFLISFNEFYFRLSDFLVPIFYSGIILIVVVVSQIFVAGFEFGERFQGQQHRDQLHKEFHQEVDFYTAVGFVAMIPLIVGIDFLWNEKVPEFKGDMFLLTFYIFVFAYTLFLQCSCPLFIAKKYRKLRK